MLEVGREMDERKTRLMARNIQKQHQPEPEQPKKKKSKAAQAEPASQTPAKNEVVIAGGNGDEDAAAAAAQQERDVPSVGVDLKRKRAPRGAARNVRPKLDADAEGDTRAGEANEVCSVPVEEDLGDEARLRELAAEEGPAKEVSETPAGGKARRESSRLRGKPVKLRDIVPTLGTKLKSSEDGKLKGLEVVLPVDVQALDEGDIIIGNNNRISDVYRRRDKKKVAAKPDRLPGADLKEGRTSSDLEKEGEKEEARKEKEEEDKEEEEKEEQKKEGKTPAAERREARSGKDSKASAVEKKDAKPAAVEKKELRTAAQERRESRTPAKEVKDGKSSGKEVKASGKDGKASAKDSKAAAKDGKTPGKDAKAAAKDAKASGKDAKAVAAGDKKDGRPSPAERKDAKASAAAEKKGGKAAGQDKKDAKALSAERKDGKLKIALKVKPPVEVVDTPMVDVPLKDSDENGLKSALQVVKRVMKMKESEPFNKPVNPVALKIPDYLDVIKDPMDLGTIRENLDKGRKYQNTDDVLRDVQLVWSNCVKYNNEGDPVVELMQTVEAAFIKHWTAAGLQYVPTKKLAAKALLGYSVSGSDRTGKADQQSHKQARGQSENKVMTDKQPPAEKMQSDKKVQSDKKPQVEKDAVEESRPSRKRKASSRNVHFEGFTPPKSKKRSAPVEQVMAESMAREQRAPSRESEKIPAREAGKKKVSSGSGESKVAVEKSAEERVDAGEDYDPSDELLSLKETVKQRLEEPASSSLPEAPQTQESPGTLVEDADTDAVTTEMQNEVDLFDAKDSEEKMEEVALDREEGEAAATAEIEEEDNTSGLNKQLKDGSNPSITEKGEAIPSAAAEGKDDNPSKASASDEADDSKLSTASEEVPPTDVEAGEIPSGGDKAEDQECPSSIQEERDVQNQTLDSGRAAIVGEEEMAGDSGASKHTKSPVAHEDVSLGAPDDKEVGAETFVAGKGKDDRTDKGIENEVCNPADDGKDGDIPPAVEVNPDDKDPVMADSSRKEDTTSTVKQKGEKADRGKEGRSHSKKGKDHRSHGVKGKERGHSSSKRRDRDRSRDKDRDRKSHGSRRDDKTDTGTPKVKDSKEDGKDTKGDGKDTREDGKDTKGDGKDTKEDGKEIKASDTPVAKGKDEKAEAVASKKREDKASGSAAKGKDEKADNSKSAGPKKDDKSKRVNGTQHHREDCPCVVCKNRRRKLADIAKEERKALRKLAASQEGAQPPRPKSKQASREHRQLLESPQQDGKPSTSNNDETDAWDADDHFTDVFDVDNVDAAESENVRFFPASYKAPPRTVGPVVSQMSKTLFGSDPFSLWSRRPLLQYRPRPTAKSPLFTEIVNITRTKGT